MNGFVFVDEGRSTKEGNSESGFVIHGGDKSEVVEATIISPGDTTFAPGESVIFRRDVSMTCSLGGKTGMLIHKDHLLARRKPD